MGFSAKKSNFEAERGENDFTLFEAFVGGGSALSRNNRRTAIVIRPDTLTDYCCKKIREFFWSRRKNELEGLGMGWVEGVVSWLMTTNGLDEWSEQNHLVDFIFDN